MWWIAACLGALLWLLVVRIKLKEKERRALREERAVRTDAQGRQVFIRDGFLPVATEYLQQDTDTSALLLLFAHFAWEDKPSEVHMEVLPVHTSNGVWPTWATDCPWVKRGEGGRLTFEPPQRHWERLTGLEPWLDKLACFAEGQPLVSGERASLEDYSVYAWARREGEAVVLEVVDEPKASNATRLQKQPDVI